VLAAMHGTGVGFVNWELQSSVVNLNTDRGGDEPVTDRFSYGESERVIE